MFSTKIERFVTILCVYCFCNSKGETTSVSSIMNISSSAGTNTIIQKIPIERTQINVMPPTVATRQQSNFNTKLSPAELLSISPAINESALSMNSSFVEDNLDTSTMKAIKLSDNSSLITIDATVKPNVVTTIIHASTMTDDIVDMDPTCPDLDNIPNLDTLTQDEFFSKLTDNCRYDRLVKPPATDPLEVSFQIDLTHVESSEHLQLKAHILVQLLYQDRRLNYTKISPTRGYILGEESLRNKIWVPHIIVLNERESSLMGLDGKDVFVQISPEGQVVYSYRMTSMFYCWMNLKKFPFDYQICEIKWVSWSYNTSNLKLIWDKLRPYHVASNLHLTEFVVEETSCNNTVVPPSFDRGGLVGNYSGVLFRMKLRREIGYYMMDYFLPSILLVCMSWVTFWLQADAAPPRVTLGTSTMLTFITLNGGLTKSLPKVSYIKASEIWFLGCASFIFFSLAEFAFVNVIWRRRKKVELKKQNSKHILKGALTPSLARKQLRKAESIHNIYKTRSCSSLSDNEIRNNIQNNYLTVHSFPSNLSVPKITTQSEDELTANEESVTTIPIPDGTRTPPPPTWTTMTPQEVAIWIDNKSRIVFPVSFLIFNIFYWSFVYVI